jgi:chemotaxis protein methyltransferase CheR
VPRTPTRAEIDLFRQGVARRFGLLFDDAKLDYLGEVICRRLAETGISDPRTYLASMDSHAESRALADLLTIGETYFFRNNDHFRVVSEAILPEVFQGGAPRRQIRILSAGCASGEEAYSLAILVRQILGTATNSRIAPIHAIDISMSVLEKARRARFSSWSLRETPPELRLRYFRDEGREAVLDPSIRDMVIFEERNLLDDDPDFWAPNRFDLAFCRNVTMYFSPEAARDAIARISRSLVPGGYLFLGHAETLRGLSADFHLVHTHETFYYRRKPAGEIRTRLTGSEPTPRSVETAMIEPLPDTTWIDAIRRASERIASLAAPRRSEPGPAVVDLTRAVELLREERYSEAMEVLPPESGRNLDALLLRAVILTNSGSPREAEEVCRRLLKLDELSAGAHYLMALCREYDRDCAGAVQHDQTAIYIDPTFAMPHLHWGMMARRAGDSALVTRELTRAAELLACEEASRILLFGGGFSRASLIELCRIQLQTAGGAS